MANRRLRGFDMDDSSVMALTGFLDTLGKDLGKSKHMYPVMRFVFDRLDEAFTLHMAAVAPGQKSRFHHVYEWNMIGVPKAKLWDTVLTGKGNARSISFNWRASKTAVPLPDPPLKPGPKGQQLRGGHVFVWKAPMMEYSMPVSISPIMSEKLAFLAKEIGETPHRNGLWFSGKTERFDAPPNSRLAAGQFTKEFLEWWAGGDADRVFDQGIRSAVEQGFSSTRVEAALRQAKTNAGAARKGNRAKAIASGRRAAEDFLNNNDRFYGHRVEVSRNRGAGGRFAGWK